MSGVRIVLADPRRLHREALAEALASEFGLDVAATTDGAESTVLQAQRTTADVIVIAAPLIGPLPRICEALRELSPRPRTLVIGGAVDSGELLHAIEAGVDGYLTPLSGLDDLAEAIHALERGESVVPPALLGPLLRGLIDSRREAVHAAERLDALTRREREVLALVVDGLDDRRIAEALTISPATARTHVQRILRKLDVHSRLDAISLVSRTGLMERLRNAAEGRLT